MRTSLSSREEQMLEMAAGGMTDQAIAYKLGISISTIGTYWGRVRIKMGPLSRTELVAIHIKERADRDLADLRKLNEKLEEELVDKEAHQDSAVFQAVLDWSPDAVVIVSRNGIIQLANKVAADLFGYTTAELKKMNVSNLIPKRFHERHNEHRMVYMENPERRMMGDHSGLPALQKDGSEFLISASLNAVDHGGEKIVVCAIRPVTKLD